MNVYVSQNSAIYEDKAELENIIKLSAKEKLQLERQLAQQPQVKVIASLSYWPSPSAIFK